MIIEKELKEISLPATYNREGKSCYYDTYRKKLIEITPEETVRQRIAKLFETKYAVPKEMISLEVPMSYYVKGVSGRADIVIHAFDKETNSKYPVTIIECKNEAVFLTDKVTDQAIRYCDELEGMYIVITNGIDIRMAAYDDKTDSYIFLDELLSYKEMVNQEYVLPEFNEDEFHRFSLEELNDQDKISEYNDAGYWIFGADTDAILRTFAVNFYQALLDVKHILPYKKCKTFELIEDIGQRYMDYSNAGGGHYDGIYRSFLVKDRFGETQIVSISIFGTDSNFRGEHRGSYTSLIVSIDRFKISHNSLQYNVDKYAKIHLNGSIKFVHNGQIGSFKSSDVLNKVEKFGDGVKRSDVGIELGNVNCNTLLYLDSKDVSNFIYNLIEYALLREEVRRDVKKK